MSVSVKSTQMESLEESIGACQGLGRCREESDFSIRLSRIGSKDARRGPYTAKVLIVTESPDLKSSQGRAYAGSTSTRIMNLFLKDEYVVCLDYDLRSAKSVWQFLIDNRIYRTSAIKCALGSSSAPLQIPTTLIERCRGRFLEKQIGLLGDLELIVPMGKVAISSVLHMPLNLFSIPMILGKWDRGILQQDQHYGKKIVALPHPSGSNPLFNPPIKRIGDSLETVKVKWRLYKALSVLRSFLEDIGYRLRKKPDSVEMSFRGPFSQE